MYPERPLHARRKGARHDQEQSYPSPYSLEGNATTKPTGDQVSELSETAAPKSAVKHCEGIIYRFLEALNGGDFSSSTWESIAPRLTFDWGILQSHDDGDGTLNLHQWLHAVRLFVAHHPDNHFEVDSITTIVDEKAGTAESLLNVELSGVFPGIIRQSVAGFGFVRTGDRWEAVRHGAFAGSGFV